MELCDLMKHIGDANYSQRRPAVGSNFVALPDERTSVMIPVHK